MKDPYFTIGEIFRSKMLISRTGKPFGDKASIIRRIRQLPHKRLNTPYGPGYAVRLSTIRAHNAQMLRKNAVKSKS